MDQKLEKSFQKALAAVKRTGAHGVDTPFMGSRRSMTLYGVVRNPSGRGYLQTIDHREGGKVVSREYGKTYKTMKEAFDDNARLNSAVSKQLGLHGYTPPPPIPWDRVRPVTIGGKRFTRHAIRITPENLPILKKNRARVGYGVGGFHANDVGRVYVLDEEQSERYGRVFVDAFALPEQEAKILGQ